MLKESGFSERILGQKSLTESLIEGSLCGLIFHLLERVLKIVLSNIIYEVKKGLFSNYCY